jgi:RHS repeat-associated protein
MRDISGSADYYYGLDHLYSPAVLFASDGSVVERYEYDAYGKANIMAAGYEPRAVSLYGNPYLFTARDLDILDGGSLKIQYNRNRYYDSYTGRWLSRDPLGIVPNAQKPNVFSPQIQYQDGMNLFEYVRSRPIIFTDFAGTSWDWTDFVGHYFNGNGEPVDLDQIGLLDTFKQTPSVFLASEPYHFDVMMAVAGAKNGLRCPNNTSTTISDSDTTTTDVTNEIFSVGRSTFFRSYTCQINIKCCGHKELCWSYSCSLNFAIKDWFRDPLDIGIEVPGGTPYQINTSWTDSLSGSTCGQ